MVLYACLARGLETYDPADHSKSRPYFNELMITLIVIPVLTILDVAYMLCVNYQKRESPILWFAVATNIAFSVVQYLAFIQLEGIKNYLLLINGIFWVIYLIISCIASNNQTNLTVANIRGMPLVVSGARYYCNYRMMTYTVSFLAFTRALGPYKWNWLFAFLPLTILYIGAIIGLISVLIYAIYATCKRGEKTTFFFLIIPVVLLIFLTPSFLWVYFLNEFEKTGAKRGYLSITVWIMFSLTLLNSFSTIRIRKYIANDELRNAIMRRRMRQLAAARQGQNNSRNEPSTPIQNVGTALKYLPVGGNYFRRQESNVEALTRKQTITGSKDENLCLVCFDKPANTIYLPCKHGGVCEDCSREIFHGTRSCPLCRKKLERIVVFEKRGDQMIKKADIM